MYRSLSPAHHEEFNWDNYDYLPVQVRNLGNFDFRLGEWQIGSKSPSQVPPSSSRAASEVQKLQDDIQKQKLTQMMLEQMIVERTLELKTIRRDLATFIINNEEIFRGSELYQASVEAREKERVEQATPLESSIERVSTGRLPEDDEDELSLNRSEERKTPSGLLKPPKYYRTGSPGDKVTRMLSA